MILLKRVYNSIRIITRNKFPDNHIQNCISQQCEIVTEQFIFNEVFGKTFHVIANPRFYVNSKLTQYEF